MKNVAKAAFNFPPALRQLPQRGDFVKADGNFDKTQMQCE